MRIKLLAAIVGFLLLSVAMSSCLGDDTETVEYSPNAILQAFELDTINGVSYTFTIDQLNGKVYNQDSLPVGSDTIINKILITTLTTSSGIVSIRNYNDTQDSLFSISDSIDLTGTMENPLRIKVWAPDMIVTKEYSIEVRVHQQEPDSLSWGDGPWATNYAPAITGRQKAALLGDRIFVYADGQPVYTTLTSDGKNWSSENVSGLPSTDITSIVSFNGKLYATVSGSGKAYSSNDGVNWSDAGLGDNVFRLLSPIGDELTAIQSITETADDGTTTTGKYFCTTDGSIWSVGESVPQNFPTKDLSATTYKNSIGVNNVLLVGTVAEPTEADTITTPWGYMKGQVWAEIYTTSKYKCPLLSTPSIMYYGGSIYAFGDDFTTFYNSVSGLVWNEVDSMFMLPEAIRGSQSDYSMVIDNDNFIWIMRSNPNEVWRGRLNRLGFKIQQ
jgi:hypothetical protein